MEEDSSRKKNEIINGVAEGEIRGDVSKEEDVESLKKRISGHPLYGLLIQAHINCFKVGFGLGEVGGTTNEADDPAANYNELIINSNISTSSPDLDHFMEGYCMALSKLKEAIEEPVEEAASFIKGMYVELRDLDTNGIPKTP